MSIIFYWIIGIILVFFAAIIFAVSLTSKKNQLATRELTIGAMCVALSYGISWVPFFSMPQGGSVTALSLLPVVIYTYAYGMRKGFILGLAYGLLQLTQKADVVHPVQLLLDYGLGFACITFAALPSHIFKYKGSARSKSEYKSVNKKGFLYALDKKHYNVLIGVAITACARFCVGTLSGTLYFWSFSGATELNLENLPIVLGYSAAYNATYIFVDAALVLAALLVLAASPYLDHIIKLMRRAST